MTVPLPAEATTNREELMSYFKLMYTMRRMEITCDTEYKVRPIPALVAGQHIISRVPFRPATLLSVD